MMLQLIEHKIISITTLSTREITKSRPEFSVSCKEFPDLACHALFYGETDWHLSGYYLLKYWLYIRD